nr:MAG: hypothetical protein [Beijing sediment noda-like virus 5]
MSVLSLALAWAADVSAALAGCSEYESHFDVAVSSFLSERCVSRAVETTRLRSVFASADIAPIAPVPGHTHGCSAARRSSASLFIDMVASSSGKDVVFRQGSASDVRNGREVTRAYYWAKDTGVAPAQRQKHENDLVAMVDVDYYLDMPRVLANHFRPHILYTFQPSSVSKDTGEYKYTANADGTWSYIVSGGGNYTHELWNYTGDSIAVERKFCGITITHSTFSVERKMVDEDHQIVLLAPMMKCVGFTAWLAKWRATAKPLRRFDVRDGDFSRMWVNGSEGLTVHTGRLGGYAKAVVTASADATIAAAMRTSTIRLSLAAVKSKMGADNSGVEILHEYHLQKSPQVPELVNVVSDGVRRFQWVGGKTDIDDGAKPGMVAFMKPLVHGGFVPDNTRNNDQRMVDYRVKKIASSSQLTPFVAKCIEEFVAHITVGEKHFLHPVDESEVYERQDRPSQRMILKKADYEAADRRAKMFMKREAYGKVTDPRGITTINGPDKRDYSRYTYAAADVVKLCSWYAFSKSPREIAERVAEICDGAKQFVDGTDFSRMDGRVSEVARHLESVLMKRLFRTEYHVELSDLMRSQHSLPGRTRNGVSYESGLSRLSGSPETSLFNTVLNAFTAYLAFRMSPGTGGGYMSGPEAWLSLGVYGGDDGLTADLSAKLAEKAASLVGQVLTAERTLRGEMGVTFLARHYGPDVWFGDSNSVCDAKRTLSKFHLTVALPSKVTPETKLFEKAYALSLSDHSTPIIGAFVTRVLKHFKKRAYENVLDIWNSETARDSHYPNVVGDWAVDLFFEQLPDFDAEAFRQWSRDASLESLLNCPMLHPAIETTIPEGLVVLEGDFHGKPLPPAISTTSTTAASEESTRRVDKARPINSTSTTPKFRARKPKSERPSRKDKQATPRGGGTKQPRTPAKKTKHGK